jgi:hypothetical protein
MSLKLSLRRWCLVVALTAVPTAYAARIVITGPGPQLRIAIGSLGTTIDTVVFDLAATSPGSGTPIIGSAPVQVEVAYKKQGAAAVTIVLTTDGSTAMACITPATCGATSIPMTQVSWTASMGQWPSGTFSGAASQLLLNFTAGGGGGAVTVREDILSYSYANATAYPAGTYQGRVTYTAVSF